MGVRISINHNWLEARAEQITVDLQNETFESQELFRRAEACILRRNFEKAETLLADALKISSENPFYLSYYGLCIGMRGDLGGAERLCSKAVKLNPTSPIILVNLGRILLEEGLRKEARDLFSRAYTIDNTNSAAALELSGMGVRRRPVIPFLARSNPLNFLLGRIRHRLLGLRPPGLKKL
ncbi:MAG: tetratricopeptide repeat protein [Candidatus Krumholzibacteria bacterium]|nr:tetratricopeptide repeat protein [Candidatus Krumholzibacteria bacterium]